MAFLSEPCAVHCGQVVCGTLHGVPCTATSRRSCALSLEPQARACGHTMRTQSRGIVCALSLT